MVALVVASFRPTAAQALTAQNDPRPVPRAHCGPGAKPETGRQGRVSTIDFTSGRATSGFSCNLQLVGHEGSLGGFRVQRYIDKAGHECAFYDTTVYIPTRPYESLADPNVTGTHVLDMSDPSKPVRTTDLHTPAMLSPHESLNLNAKRGLLAADLGNTAAGPGWVDIYDVSQDCRHPKLRSTLPLGVLGHEGTFAPDGMTFYVTSPVGFFVGVNGLGTITALDISNPASPRVLWTSFQHVPHGLNVSNDGRTLYMADGGKPRGLKIFDISQIQERKPHPQVKLLSRITWPTVSIPQTAIPVTINHHPYLIEVDEFANNTNLTALIDMSAGSDPRAKVGAARIIDIADPRKPKIVSDIRLQVNTAKDRAGPQGGDPGAGTATAYAAHYCWVPTRTEPRLLACTFILSGLRLFDIRDPLRPKEIAYFNPPSRFDALGKPVPYGAVSAPAFVPERKEIWYTDANYGFYVLRVTNGVWPSKN